MYYLKMVYYKIRREVKHKNILERSTLNFQKVFQKR
jgi:hypothetical protein